MTLNKLRFFLGIPLKTSICAMHSDELIYGIKDQSTKQHTIQLSDRFGELLVRCELFPESAELYQIGDLIGVDIFPLCEMCYYWDDEDKTQQLSHFLTHTEQEKELELIEKMNKMLAQNIDIVHATVVYLNARLNGIHQLDEQLVNNHDSLIDYQTYFRRSENPTTQNFFTDLEKIIAFIQASRSTELDTFYFKIEASLA